MVGLIGIGQMPRHFLDKVHYWIDKLVPFDLQYIYVYPWFFDDKRLLLKGRWVQYRVKLLATMMRDSVFYAVWPDNVCRDINLPNENITYIYPIHDVERDFECASRLEKDYFIMYGFPTGEYSVRLFLEKCRELGISSWQRWLMGYKPKYFVYIKEFHGTDLTTMSIRGYNFAKIKQDGAKALVSLALKLLRINKQNTLDQYIKVIG